MRVFLTMVLAIALTAGAAVAGCGNKVTSEGTLKSYDSAKKTIVVEVDGQETTLQVTPKTEGADQIQAMVGSVVKSHDQQRTPSLPRRYRAIRRCGGIHL